MVTGVGQEAPSFPDMLNTHHPVPHLDPSDK